MSRVRNSLLYAFAENYLGMALQFISILIVVRLLSPAEIGVFAVGAVFASIASTVRDFGVGEFLIAQTTLKPQQIRAALFVNIAISWSMGVALFVASFFLGDFYRDPGVATVVRIQALNFALIPFGAVLMAYYRRELNYRPAFFASLAANLTTFVVGTGTVLMGYSYLGLAWASVAGVLATVLCSRAFQPHDFPRLPSPKGAGEVLAFGKHATGIYVFGQLGKNAPELVLGRVLDMGAVGLFSRASGLIDLFNRTVLRAVLPICLPYFSATEREGGDTKGGYLRVMTYLTALAWPFFAVLALVAAAVVALLYGAQWAATVPLVVILAAVGAVEVIHALSKELLISIGKVAASNRLQIVVQSLRVLALFAAIPWGLMGACWGLLAAAVVGTVAMQWTLWSHLGLHLGEVLGACWKSTALAALSTLPVLLWDWTLGPTTGGDLLRCALLGGAAAAVWLGALFALRHPLAAELMRPLRWLFGKLKGRP